jgi:hypothetical protein
MSLQLCEKVAFYAYVFVCLTVVVLASDSSPSSPVPSTVTSLFPSHLVKTIGFDGEMKVYEHNGLHQKCQGLKSMLNENMQSDIVDVESTAFWTTSCSTTMSAIAASWHGQLAIFPQTVSVKASPVSISMPGNGELKMNGIEAMQVLPWPERSNARLASDIPSYAPVCIMTSFTTDKDEATNDEESPVFNSTTTTTAVESHVWFQFKAWDKRAEPIASVLDNLVDEASQIFAFDQRSMSVYLSLIRVVMSSAHVILQDFSTHLQCGSAESVRNNMWAYANAGDVRVLSTCLPSCDQEYGSSPSDASTSASTEAIHAWATIMHATWLNLVKSSGIELRSDIPLVSVVTKLPHFGQVPLDIQQQIRSVCTLLDQLVQLDDSDTDTLLSLVSSIAQSSLFQARTSVYSSPLVQSQISTASLLLWHGWAHMLSHGVDLSSSTDSSLLKMASRMQKWSEQFASVLDHSRGENVLAASSTSCALSAPVALANFVRFVQMAASNLDFFILPSGDTMRAQVLGSLARWNASLYTWEENAAEVESATAFEKSHQDQLYSPGSPTAQIAIHASSALVKAQIEAVELLHAIVLSVSSHNIDDLMKRGKSIEDLEQLYTNLLSSANRIESIHQRRNANIGQFDQVVPLLSSSSVPALRKVKSSKFSSAIRLVRNWFDSWTDEKVREKRRRKRQDRNRRAGRSAVSEPDVVAGDTQGHMPPQHQQLSAIVHVEQSFWEAVLWMRVSGAAQQMLRHKFGARPGGEPAADTGRHRSRFGSTAGRQAEIQQRLKYDTERQFYIANSNACSAFQRAQAVWLGTDFSKLHHEQGPAAIQAGPGKEGKEQTSQQLLEKLSGLQHKYGLGWYAGMSVMHAEAWEAVRAYCSENDPRSKSVMDPTLLLTFFGVVVIPFLCLRSHV